MMRRVIKKVGGGLVVTICLLSLAHSTPTVAAAPVVGTGGQDSVPDASGSDPWKQRSVGLGQDLAQASVLQVKGDKQGAATLVAKVRTERPYDRNLAYGAVLALGPDVDVAAQDDAFRRLAKLEPVVMDQIFLRSFVQGRYEEAVSIYPLIVAPQDLSWWQKFQTVSSQEREAQQVDADRLRQARFAGVYAYALVTLGKSAEALEAIKIARGRLIAGGRDGAALDLWSVAVEGRRAATVPADILALDRQTAELAGAELLHPPRDNLQLLLKYVPAAESARDIPTYEPARLPSAIFGRAAAEQFGQGGEGYSSMVSIHPGVVLVRFRGVRGTAAMSEELALLRAAEMTKAAGKARFVIANRMDAPLVRRSTYRSFPNGYETELSILYLDTERADWRAFVADEVIAALAPIYRIKAS